MAVVADITFDAIIEVDTIVDWLETYQSVVDEARIHVREDSLYAIPVDPANVAMVEQTLHATAFESYEAREFEIGVDLGRLQDYVESGDDDLVHIQFDAERAMLDISSGSVDLEMACIDPDTIRNDGKIPEGIFAELGTDITVDAGAFEHSIDVVDMVSDHVIIDSDPDRDAPVHVTAEGDTDTARIEFENSLHEGSTVDEKAESLFSIDYLDNLTGEIPKGVDLRIQAGDELPAVLEYEYADGNVECRMMCAPRISTE